jgi:quercetin 2,3-dioxygenase
MSFDPESRVDPLRRGFHALESFNEENLGPGMGLHPPVQREIVTYVREGILALQGEGGPGRLGAGEFQYMSASPGVRHHALNESPTDTAHVYQSRVTAGPDVEAHPVREQKLFPTADREGILRLVVSPDGGRASLRGRQDVRIFSAVLLLGHHLVHEIALGRGAWLHVVKGRVVIRDLELAVGDAVALDGEAAISFTAREPAEILLFDLA